MKIGRRAKIVSLMVIGLVIAAILIWFFIQSHKERLAEKEREHPANTASQLSTPEREKGVSLDRTTQARSGIAIAPLEWICHQKELQAYGIVLGLQGLMDLRTNLVSLRRNLIVLKGNYAAAKADVEKTEASLSASWKEYERLKPLYENNRNISDRVFQAGEATWRSDDASARASKDALRAAEDALNIAKEALQVLNETAMQQWGGVLSKWLFHGSSAFERLLKQQDVLVQVTLPLGVQVSSPPESVRLQTGTGPTASAGLISPSPRTDPRIQGLTFFYFTHAQANMLPGMNARVYLPEGQKVQGVWIPSSASVWWQGKAWAYVQKGEERFVRHEVPTENPVENGFFVSQGFQAGDRVVVKGAQLLLSEELVPKTQMKEAGEQD